MVVRDFMKRTCFVVRLSEVHVVCSTGAPEALVTYLISRCECGAAHPQLISIGFQDRLYRLSRPSLSRRREDCRALIEPKRGARARDFASDGQGCEMQREERPDQSQPERDRQDCGDTTRRQIG